LGMETFLYILFLLLALAGAIVVPILLALLYIRTFIVLYRRFTSYFPDDGTGFYQDGEYTRTYINPPKNKKGKLFSFSYT
jgi:hypothetical protein